MCATVKRIGNYLKVTVNLVKYILPSDSIFKVWDDVDFRGNWLPEEAKYDLYMSRSWSGYVVSCLGCPVIWKLQIQMETSLRFTDSEYIGLIQELCKTISIINPLKEIKFLIFFFKSGHRD